MSWLKKIIPSLSTSVKKEVPTGVWSSCEHCNAYLYKDELKRHNYVCHKCNHHHRIPGRERLNIFLDEGSAIELAEDVRAIDWLKFRDTKRYKDRLSQATKKTKEHEAIIVQQGLLKGLPIVASAFDFSFIGGSMGAAVGEKFVQGVEHACAMKMPFICFCSSGGARMQEGLISLMQMAKTSAALTQLSGQNLPYIVVLTDPTTGGVSASLAMLGDVIIAEPNALIGFAGPRVIEQTVREVLPEGFQRSEFLFENGAIDRIVPRAALRDTIYAYLDIFMVTHA